jgi:spermidine synthase
MEEGTRTSRPAGSTGAAPALTVRRLRMTWRAFLPKVAAISRQAAALLALAAMVTVATAKDERTLIDSRESLYNQIYVYKQNDWLLLTFGFNKALFIESAYNPSDESELPAPYTRFMTAGLAYARDIGSILEIGFGGGRTAWYLHRAALNAPVTSVELDPVVIELSHKYFGVKDEPNFTTVNEDGRQFLVGSSARYDIILLDAFHGPTVPFHLLTSEFYRLVASRLNEGGVVLQNLDPDNALFDSAVKTMATAFAQTDLYLADGNAVIVAYQGEPRPKDELAKLAKSRQAEFKPRYDLADLVGQRRLSRLSDAVDPNAKLLTDDFAPAEMLKMIDKHNRQWPSPSEQP